MGRPPSRYQTGDGQMTDSIALTTKEAKVLLSYLIERADYMSMTGDELDVLEAKLRAGPVRHENILTDRMKEAIGIADCLAPNIMAKLDIVELGVRITLVDTRSPYGRQRTHICSWTEVIMCRINPLPFALDRMVKDMDHSL